MCRIHFCYVSFVIRNATYHLVVLSFERVVAILFPCKYRSLNLSAIAKRVSSAVTLATLVASFAPSFFIEYNSAVQICGPGDDYGFVLLYGMVIYVGIPSCTLIAANLVFVWALAKRRQKHSSTMTNVRGGVEATESTAAMRQRSDNSYSRMMIVTSTFYVALLLTGLKVTMIAFRLSEREPTAQIAHWLSALGQLIIVVNHSVKFCFYWASGEMFRGVFIKAFPRISCKHQTEQSRILEGRPNEAFEMQER